MADLGLWKQGWRWVVSQKHILTWAHMAASGGTERLAFLVDRHWPAVSRACVSSGRLALAALRQWRGCAARGILEMASLGPASVFVILWSFFVCITSPACALYALLGMGAAGAVIHYMGYTPGLFIVGLFGILIMWMYGYFWITGMLLIAGGCMCSLKHARFVIPVLAMYAVYCVAVRVGSLGVFLTLNLSFLTNDLLNKLLQGYEGSTEERQFEEPKHSDPVMDEFYRSCEFPSAPDSEPETVSSAKPFCSTPVQDVLHVQKEASPSKVVKSDSVSLDEMKRIMDGLTHYEVLGIPRNRSIDQKILKKEYHRMVLLVHPDKNMGNPLACESFKKLQSAYEVLSDFTKKNTYDDQLRKEESRKMTQRSRVVSQQTGVEFLSEESRRIQCTKCGNFHLWICTKKSKAKARWCQDCSDFHPAKDGDGWVENKFSSSFKEIPRAFVCAESKVFDVSEWATCQGMECKPNTHGPSFMVNMVGADRMSQRSYSSRYPFSLNAEMIPEDEFELWLQQALASGVFSDSPKRRKSWSPFKLPQKGIKSWRRSS
ncbi:uncharacterized protein [Oryza sativa Japonica Group]|uniref:DNAJ heat shock N-terminal domain-containing protein, putative, expressed n=6 Tax=Oryza TaxID=4527 RepID=Q2QMA0_ORYSJ|nr:uncharacterized protein LOC4352775 [Oryza sativa Japonica Group]XP_052138876.1 uncharacterized protein LOC127757415 [Oryza glaberrima]KAB8118179.1 hypothetical protein EE612_060895 [Oryza sativa]ABA99382.1 DNAJ heat shock N-terminal domain-containing protein, putative, expressed [Oryza sativa Japonica Group]KAF2908797.1 hypothetical protein DAI22_12g209400 [Oryza sativa Japonica Group]BAF30277.1 Os12g0612400 [Oryza sativa Japonica Group]BAT18047.1 Os12g0612400 [Oryza sativa Japonica Group]|eukprot:NP_001067258.1 Os12g0612400 [Oryza sativa Japonica Group]